MQRTLVILAALFVAFCNYGILNAYGALFTATLELFGEGRSKTSLIHAVLIGTSLGSGVIGGYFIKRFNHTVVSAIGSVLLPVGLIVSYWATSVTFLIISIGIVSGVGISFTYVTAVVTLSTVTPEKHKTSMLSVQNVACGVPGIVVPYLFSWLTTTYTLYGTFLIYGGILLNNLVATFVFSGVRDTIEEKELDSDLLKERNNLDQITNTDTVNNNPKHVPDVIKSLQLMDSIDVNYEKVTEFEDGTDSSNHGIIFEKDNIKSTAVHITETQLPNDDIKSGELPQLLDDVTSMDHYDENRNENGFDGLNSEILKGPKSEFTQSKFAYDDVKSVEATEPRDNTYMDCIYISENRNRPVGIKRSTRVTYVLFLVAESLVLANIAGIQILYQDIGAFKGLTADEILVCISAYNIASTIGRFLPAVFQKLSENPFLTPIVACLSGVSGQVLIMMTSQYYSLLIGYALTGLTDGGASASASVVIFKILRQESQAVGFGLLLTVIGILATGSGPLYGAIFDKTESYTLVLSLTTGSLAFGSILFVACFVSYRN